MSFVVELKKARLFLATIYSDIYFIRKTDSDTVTLSLSGNMVLCNWLCCKCLYQYCCIAIDTYNPRKYPTMIYKSTYISLGKWPCTYKNSTSQDWCRPGFCVVWTLKCTFTLILEIDCISDLNSKIFGEWFVFDMLYGFYISKKIIKFILLYGT